MLANTTVNNDLLYRDRIKGKLLLLPFGGLFVIALFSLVMTILTNSLIGMVISSVCALFIIVSYIWLKSINQSVFNDRIMSVSLFGRKEIRYVDVKSIYSGTMRGGKYSGNSAFYRIISKNGTVISPLSWKTYNMVKKITGK